jgi:hypothetical protein
MAIATLLPHFFGRFWQSVAVTFSIVIKDLQRFFRFTATLSILFLILYFLKIKIKNKSELSI